MSFSLKTPDDVLRSNLALSVIALVFLGWFAGVFVLYDLPRSLIVPGLWQAAKNTLDTPSLWVGPAVGFAIGCFAFAYFVSRYENHYGGAQFIKRLRGPKMVNPRVLSAMTKKGDGQLRFAGIPVPKEVESTQFFIGGSTGSGKSVAISDYIESALRRGDRLICVDPDGGFMRYFYRHGDLILNPFDKRGQGWSIFNEIRNSFDCEQYAISMIPRSPDLNQESWNSMARTIVSETLSVLLAQGSATTERLVHWLTIASNEQLKALLAGTPAAGCFHGAEDTLASIRTVLTQYITPHKYLSPGDFSFRDWLDNGKGSLWITWREDMLQALKPLISCWVDVTCASVLSMPEDRDRRMHLVCDELDSLEKLNYIIDAATKGRKKGLRIMPGIQSLSQLNGTYGNDDALTLRNCFRSSAMFGIGELDTYTAEEFSRGLGEHTVVRKSPSTTAGSAGARVSMTHRQDTERIVSPAEIHLLRNLTGYVKLAGNYPIARVAMKYKKRDVVIEAIVMADEFQDKPQERNRLFIDGHAALVDDDGVIDMAGQQR